MVRTSSSVNRCNISGCPPYAFPSTIKALPYPTSALVTMTSTHRRIRKQMKKSSTMKYAMRGESPACRMSFRFFRMAVVYYIRPNHAPLSIRWWRMRFTRTSAPSITKNIAGRRWGSRIRARQERVVAHCPNSPSGKHVRSPSQFGVNAHQRGKLFAGMDFELAVDVVHMRLDRALRDEHIPTDLVVRLSSRR